MTLTNDEKKIIRNLVISHMKYQSIIGEFEMTVKYDECTDEEVDALNAVCENPSGKLLDIPGGWISATYSVADDSYEIFGSYHM